jgi:dethiobiotin synthetase
MSRHGIYVTGTDTGIGKTFCSVALLRALAGRGRRAVGMKPVASGCEAGPDGLRNEDALALIDASPSAPRYPLVNPYALAEPTAPEIAAAQAGVAIALDPLIAAYAELRGHGIVVVEGVGGWLAPLSDRLMQSDLARRLELPVLLVVGLRLGCINHALLSARAIAADGLPLIGWVCNRIDPAMLHAEQTIGILRQRLPAPCLGVVPHRAGAELAAAALSGAADALGG